MFRYFFFLSFLSRPTHRTSNALLMPQCRSPILTSMRRSNRIRPKCMHCIHYTTNGAADDERDSARPQTRQQNAYNNK